MIRSLLPVVLFACASNANAPLPDANSPLPPASPPRVHVKADPNYMDTAWCHLSFVPIQDPVFPTIRRDRFQADSNGIVITPDAWLVEAKGRVPQLQTAVDSRARDLLAAATEAVGRAFEQRDFDFTLYFCPYFNGGTAIPGIYPIFPYLRAAVDTLQFPDWIFTDEYVFHEILHRYVMERVDYARGTPTLNALYPQLVNDVEFRNAVAAHLGHSPSEAESIAYVGLVMTHIHVYAIMTQAYRSIGEVANLERIRTLETVNAAPHPSYVRAWKIVAAYDERQLDAVGVEVR